MSVARGRSQLHFPGPLANDFQLDALSGKDWKEMGRKVEEKLGSLSPLLPFFLLQDIIPRIGQGSTEVPAHPCVVPAFTAQPLLHFQQPSWWALVTLYPPLVPADLNAGGLLLVLCFVVTLTFSSSNTS